MKNLQMKFYINLVLLLVICALFVRAQENEHHEHESGEIKEGGEEPEEDHMLNFVNSSEFTKSIETSALKEILDMPEKDFSDILSVIDGDADDVIEKHEMMFLFTMMDENNDKSVTKRELSTWFNTITEASVAGGRLDKVFALLEELDVFLAATVIEKPKDDDEDGTEITDAKGEIVPCLIQNNAALPFYKPLCAKDESCASGKIYEQHTHTYDKLYDESDFPLTPEEEAKKAKALAAQIAPASDDDQGSEDEAEDVHTGKDAHMSEEGEHSEEDFLKGDDDEEEPEQYEFMGRYEVLFGLFDRNMDEKIEPFEIVTFADEMDLDNDGFISPEELVMWISGAEYQQEDILKLLQWDESDFPNAAEMQRLLEQGHAMLHDEESEELAAKGVNTFDHDGYAHENPIEVAPEVHEPTEEQESHEEDDDHHDVDAATAGEEGFDEDEDEGEDDEGHDEL